MGRLTGIALIVAGVALGGYTLSARRDAPAEAARAQDVPVAGTQPVSQAGSQPAVSQVAPVPALVGSPPAAIPASLPGAAPAAAPATAPITAPATAPGPSQVAPGVSESAGEASPAPAAASAPSQAAAARPGVAASATAPAKHRVRNGASPTLRIGEAPPRVPVGDSKAGVPLSPVALTREIQRQLKRIGCYQGAANGIWTPAVQQALKTVTERGNASLPVEQPDPVLLAMVQSQAPGACAASCPTGQGRAADGRCLPTALVANAAKLRPPPPAAQAARAPQARVKAARDSGASRAAAAASVPASEGRMSLAGPPVRERRAVRAAPTVAARPRTTTRHATRTTTWSRSASARGQQRAASQSFFGFWPF